MHVLVTKLSEGSRLLRTVVRFESFTCCGGDLFRLHLKIISLIISKIEQIKCDVIQILFAFNYFFINFYVGLWFQNENVK